VHFLVKKKKKMRFEVQENETVDQCLERMNKEGYQPVGKIEKPIFAEVMKDGQVTVEPVKRQIIFEGKLVE
jgi:hypothetical protein